MNKKDELEMFVLDDVYEVIEIDFLDHKIKTVIDEYQNIWISIESICDHLKIDSEKEIESLIDSDLDVWILKVFDSNFGKYDLFMINIGSIKLWLNTIHFNHIKFGSRNILIKYIKEIVDIITNAAVVLSNNSICNTENNNEVIGEEVVFDKDSAIEKVRKQKEIKNSNIKEKIEIKNDETIDVVEVDFCDGRIELLKYCSDIWINVKSVCDLFGISYSEQHIKLESRDWKDWVIWKILNKKFVIHLYCFRDWLFKLDPSKLQEDKRNILIRYRKEVTIDAIQKAFSEEIKRDKSIDEVEDGTVKRDTFEEEKDEEMKEEKMSYPFYFEDEIVITFIYEGKPCWIAKDIGDILGYARDGRALIPVIKDWSKNEFIYKGDDYVILTGKELKQFKETARSVSAFSSHLVILFKGGLELVCDRKNNSIGRKLKKFLIEEVVSQIDKPEEKKINKEIKEEKTEVITTSCKEEGTDIVPVREKTYQVVEVDFYDGTIHAIMDEDGNIWMSVRRACEHIGIDPEGQRQRLSNPERSPWAVACMIKAIGPDGKMYKNFMLHIDSVPAWFFKIELSRIANPKSKEVLTKYQLEVANVLRNYFLGNRMQQFGRYEIPSYPDTLRAYADLLEKNNLLVIERDGAISEAKHQSYLANNMAMRLESKKDAISVGEKLASSKGGLTIADFGNAVKINGKVYGSGKMRELLKRWGVFTKDDKKPRNYRLRERQWFEVNIDFYRDEDGILNQLSCIVITTKGQMNVLLKMSNDVEFEGKSIVFDGEEYNGQGYFPFKNKKKNEKF